MHLLGAISRHLWPFVVERGIHHVYIIIIAYHHSLKFIAIGLGNSLIMAFWVGAYVQRVASSSPPQDGLRRASSLHVSSYSLHAQTAITSKIVSL